MTFSFITLDLTASHAQTILGTLASSTTLSAASSPWRVTGKVIVENGVTLTFKAGCTLYFDSGDELKIRSGEQLIAVGDPHRPITMTRQEGTTEKWDGISL